MARTSRDDVLGLAADQHGLFTTAQARERGVTRPMLQHWRRSGGLSKAGRSVWAVDGAPSTEHRRALALVLDRGPGAALARSSAAWVWMVPGHRLDPASIVRARGDRPSPSVANHSSRLFDDSDVTTRHGIPVTTPLRTLFDLAGSQHPLRTRYDLNDLTARGLVRVEDLDRELHRLARRGRDGIRVMRGLLAELEAKGAPAGSNLELRVEEILETAGFRDLERQLALYDEDGFIARVDFGDRRRRIAIEVDSDRFHGGLVDRQVDAAKTARIAAVGWTILRITEREVWHDRPRLVARLRAVRHTRRREIA